MLKMFLPLFKALRKLFNSLIIHDFSANKKAHRERNIISNSRSYKRELWYRSDNRHVHHITQNAKPGINTCRNSSIWIENSSIGKGWKISHHSILTGIPENNWFIDVPAGVCLDLIRVNDSQWCIRPYGFRDTFLGTLEDEKTLWLGKPANENGFIRELLKQNLLKDAADIRFADIFPVIDQRTLNDGGFIQALLLGVVADYSGLYLSSLRLSADAIQQNAKHERIDLLREKFKLENLNK